MRAKNMQALTNEFKARHPGITVYGIGDDAHKTRISDHNEDDTAGSKAAQSDVDTVPEHRAIDVMLGPALTATQMQADINEILASARLRGRLNYINFLNWQWSASSGWVRHDNSDDPHPTHAHFSGRASNDEDTSGWFTNGDTVLNASRGMGSAIAPNDNVLYLQRKMLFLVEGDPRLAEHPLAVDGWYGAGTSYWVSVLLTGGDGEAVNGAWFAVLDEMVTDKIVGNGQTSTPLPASLTLTIPAMTVTATL
jgi:hypothetical protein